MAATRVLNGTYREVWQETTATNFDGGTTVAITTGIRVDRTAAPVTTWLSDCKAEVFLTSKIGNPVVTTPVLSMNGSGFLVVTFSNTAGVGNMAAYTLDVIRLHSIQQGVDTTYNGTGVVIDASAFSSSPATGTMRFYVDGTAGDDAHGGTSWIDAFKTLARAETAAHSTLAGPAGLPTNLALVIYVRGTFATAEILRLNDPLVGQTRVYVVHPFDQWTATTTGTLTTILVGPADAGHGLQAIEPSFVVDASMLGKVLRFEEQGGTAAACVTILKVDIVSNYLWISRTDGDPFPMWVADGGATDLSVLTPSMTAPSGLAIHLSGSMVSAAGTWVTTSPKSWVVGMVDTSLYVTGPCCGCIGLYDTRAGFGTPDTITSTGIYFEGRYQRWTMGAANPGLPDTLAAEFGIFTDGGFGAENQDLGNCVTTASLGGDYNCFAGVASAAIDVAGGTGVVIYCFNSITVTTSGPCSATIYNGIVCPSGFGAQAGVVAGAGAFLSVASTAYESADSLVFFQVVDGGYMMFASGMFTQPFATKYSVANPTIVFHAYNGTMTIGNFGDWSNPPQMAGATNLVRVDPLGEVELLGAILQGFPGGGADFYVVGGKIHFAGGVTKQTVNTTVGGTARPILQIENCGVATQPDGMGGVFQVDEGAGDYVTAYGANGAIYLTQNATARLAGLTSHGPATRVGCTIRNGSKLCHSGVGLSGATPLVLGANPVAAWPATATSEPTEACTIIPNL